MIRLVEEHGHDVKTDGSREALRFASELLEPLKL